MTIDHGRIRAGGSVDPTVRVIKALPTALAVS